MTVIGREDRKKDILDTKIHLEKLIAEIF